MCVASRFEPAHCPLPHAHPVSNACPAVSQKFRTYKTKLTVNAIVLGMDLGLRESKRTKKDSDASIPLADAQLRAVIAPHDAPRAPKVTPQTA